MISNYRRSLLALAAAFVGAGALHAAPLPVEFRVQATAGAALAGATVEIVAESGDAFTASGATDAEGHWAVDLPDTRRPYRLKVTAAEHQPSEQSIDLKGQRGSRSKPVGVTVELRPFTAEDYFNAGRERLFAKDLAKATVEFRKAVEKDPSLARGWSVLAMLEIESGQAAAALEHADRALAVDPTEMQALRTRYDALLALRRAEEATKTLDELYQKDKSPDTGRLLFNAGAEAANGGDSASARLRLGQALELEPKLWQAHTALAELAIREQRLDDAVASLDQAIAISPRNFKAWERKIEVLRAMGKSAEADAAAAQLAELKGAS